MSVLDRVLGAIRAHHFRYTNEDELQEGLALVLGNAGLEVQREVILSETDRIDLLVEEEVGVEVKVGGNSAGAFQQLQRYASHDRIKQLVLITNRWQSFPEEAGGKPLTVYSLVEANL